MSSSIRSVGVSGLLLIAIVITNTQVSEGQSQHLRKLQERKLSSYTLGAEYTYCDADDWEAVFATKTPVNDVDECAAEALANGSPAFLIFEEDANVQCVVCSAGESHVSGIWDVTMYFVSAGVADTPMPTAGVPVNVVATPMPTEATPMPTTPETPMPTTPQTPMPTDVVGTPIPTVSQTPAPTWSPADVGAFFADWEAGCELLLNVDECQAWALANSFAFETHDDANLPRGCMQQYPDNVVISNTYASWSAVDLSSLCFYEDSLVTSCLVRMLCREEEWMIQESTCATGGDLTEGSCEAIGGVHNLYGAGYSTTNSDQYPASCFADPSSKTVMWNAHPVGSSDVGDYKAICAKVVTPMPTPLLTPSPTWAPGPAKANFASWGEGCQLLLNVDECQAWASEKSKVFETHYDTNLPRGCMQQYPDKVVIFNSYAQWAPVSLESLCLDDSGGSPCLVRMLCRKEDWYTGDTACDAGKGLSQGDCQRLGYVHNLYGAGYGTTNSAQVPAGCYADPGSGRVMWNAHAVGLADEMYLTFCAEGPEPCASTVVGSKNKKRNKWCRKHCETKKKSKCSAKCPDKCTAQCNCNTRCLDSTTWYINVEDDNGWFQEHGCYWVSQDPDARCKMKGQQREGGKKIKAFKQCPTACPERSKCYTRRLTSQALV